MKHPSTFTALAGLALVFNVPVARGETGLDGPIGISRADHATVAQVGLPAGGGDHYVALMVRDLEGGMPASGYAVYGKPGGPDAAAAFTCYSKSGGTTHVPTLDVILQRAQAAGLDNMALGRAVDALGGEPAPVGTLAERLSWILRGDFSDNGNLEQKALLVRVFPQVAMACGVGWIGRVPVGEHTFELRRYDASSGAEGPVVGRVTTAAAPAILPAPGGASEMVQADPRGHLRIHLRWWLSAQLRDRVPHLCGFNVYRADRQGYIAATGGAPPAAMSAAQLQAALGSGLLTKVNACPILPDTLFESPPPPDNTDYFFVDDNDSAEQGRFDEGGAPFADGQRLTYYVAACDYFGRPGTPSPGLEVTACDRMPPSVPSGLRADPVYEGGEHFVRLSWDRAGSDEVGRYLVYAYSEPSEAMPDIRHPGAPETPNLVAIIENPGLTGDRVVFDHLGEGALSLPTDAGKTRWYSVRAEDDASCKAADGYGNLSLPSGTVPASLYGFGALGAPVGHLLVRCCEIEGSLSTGGPAEAQTITLAGARSHPSIRWVQFRESQHGTNLGHHEFGDSNHVAVPVPTFGLAGVRFEARFGRDTGYVGDWIPGAIYSAAVPDHTWTARLDCGRGLGRDPDCERHPYFPVDPVSGEIVLPCGEFEHQVGEHMWRVFRRLGFEGNLSLVASGKFAETTQWCDRSVPAHNVTVCYFGQTSDQDGNPSPMVLLGCLHLSRPDNLPVPVIRSAKALPGADLLAVTAPVRIDWNCPRPGVECFDLAVFPAVPGMEVITDGGIEWGIVKSPRIPNGYGAGGTVFALDLDLPKGFQYVAKVRARGFGPPDSPDERAMGGWSEPVNIRWSPDAGVQNGQLPWPYRNVTGLDPAQEMIAEFDPLEVIGRVSIGVIPVHVSVITSGTPTSPDFVVAPTLQPFLTKPLPVVVYRHETSPGARHEMVQVSPMIRDFWKASGLPGQLQIDNPFVTIRKRVGAGTGDPYHIWVRDTQPLIAGKTYRYTLTCFGSDGEITGSVASQEFTPEN